MKTEWVKVERTNLDKELYLDRAFPWNFGTEKFVNGSEIITNFNNQLALCVEYQVAYLLHVLN